MHLQRSTKIRFVVFTVIALTAMNILAFGYGHLGTALWGAGRYSVTVQLPQSAGLYNRANVTYFGSTIGEVTDVKLTATGEVNATLRLKSDVTIPSDATAEVHSQSAIGEQFIALVPGGSLSRPLRNGDTITRAAVPPDINDQLNMLNTALVALPKDSLKTLTDESYTALGGLGPQLSRSIDAANNLAIDTNQSLTDLTNVIDNSGPLLDSQVESADAITSWAAHMDTITGQLQTHNDAVSGVLSRGAPTAEAARATLERLKPSVPILLANLVSFADVGVVYNPNLEQLLVLFPQAIAQVGSTLVPNMNTKQDYRGSAEQFALNLNLPPPCTTGYLPASQRLAPAVQDTFDRPDGDFYCRIPQDAPFNVRGARNIPCEGKPWRRAPLVWMCENDIDYVPLNDGNNWKGDPNATFTGQDVPQLRPGEGSPALAEPASPHGSPPPNTPPLALGVADYNPADGTYLGSDGQIYTQQNLAQEATTPTLSSLLAPGHPDK
ncbi:MCE family protein [Mycolicibacterium setense]